MEPDSNYYQQQQPTEQSGLVSERQNPMSINRPNLLNSIKQKCLSRLTEHRRSAIQKMRQEQMHLLTESKRKKGYIEQQVHNDMMRDNVMQGVIMQEISQIPQMSVDDWNREYQQIYNELHQYLARQMIESTTFDESYHYEIYERANEEEIEALAKTYDPANNDFYVCAVCKRYVYKVRGTRICCERPGCIDIDLGNPNFKLEDVMNLVMRVVIEHREGCENQGIECCPEHTHMRVKVARINEIIRSDSEEENKSNDSQALFVTCDRCAFLDFVSLY